MILDAYGQPARTAHRLTTPKWLSDQMLALLKPRSYGPLITLTDAPCAGTEQAGTHITVKLPPRYAKESI